MRDTAPCDDDSRELGASSSRSSLGVNSGICSSAEVGRLADDASTSAPREQPASRAASASAGEGNAADVVTMSAVFRLLAGEPLTATPSVSSPTAWRWRRERDATLTAAYARDLILLARLDASWQQRFDVRTTDRNRPQPTATDHNRPQRCFDYR